MDRPYGDDGGVAGGDAGGAAGGGDGDWDVAVGPLRPFRARQATSPISASTTRITTPRRAYPSSDGRPRNVLALLCDDGGVVVIDEEKVIACDAGAPETSSEPEAGLAV